MHDLTCVVHLHSTHSDGTGTVAQIARAAQRAGIDVVLLTDHDTLAGEERWYGDVLVLVGEEVTPRNRDHYLAFDIEKCISPRLTGPEICDAVRAQGGFGFAAHPWSRGNDRFKRGGYPWGDFDCLDGIELWSFLNDTGERLTGIRDLARMVLAPQSIIGGPPERNLREWDRMCRERRVVAVGGLDAHQFGIRIAGHVPIRLMGYARTFRQLHTHVLVEREPTRELEHDRALVYEALREGRCYIANDQVADARGFEFSHMGEEIRFEPGIELHARTPQPAQIRLLREGETVAAADGSELRHSIELHGAYRIEAELHGKPWIFSNPVYLRAYS
ncbi:MAG TPA: CehA/McbA family metallohydrolase [Thermoleophilaceae bacterium]